MSSDQETILGSGFTADWVGKIICESEDVTNKIKSHKAEKIGVGQGFLSHIIRMEIEWEKPNKDLPKTVVLKVPTLDTLQPHIDQMTEKLDDETKDRFDKDMMDKFLLQAHTNEIRAYELFRKYTAPIVMPKSYYGCEIDQSGRGILIMEDMSDVGITVNICDGLNMEQVLNVAHSLAHLHAWSLTHSWWEDKFKGMDREEINDWPVMMNGTADALKEMKPEWFTELMDKLAWSYDPEFMYNHVYLSFLDLKLKPVLVQGDMWTNNLLFEKKDNGTMGNELKAIIDWQIAHSGSCAEDIARYRDLKIETPLVIGFLVMCIPGEIRRKEGDNVLKSYHTKLLEIMGDQCPYTFQDVKMSYERMLPFAATFYLMGVPVMCNSPIVEGPNKDKKVEEMLLRSKMMIEDVIDKKDMYREYLNDKK